MPTASAHLAIIVSPVTSDRLRYVAGSFGAVQLVATPQRVLVDLQARNHTVSGHLTKDHATAVIPLADAKRLLAELAAAVAQAESLPIPPAAPTWSDETVRRLALASPVRRHPNRRRAQVSA